NIGATLADMGLDAWANHYAQSSYYPYWGGSHLFLAQRYEGDYDQTSELLAGFLADPTAFGADPARQHLLSEPGAYGELQGMRIGSKALDMNEYSLTGNGYDNAALPFAWFGQGSRTQITPGNAPITADANNALLGAGVRLTPELSAFAFASHFHIASTIAGQPDSLNDNRVDAGASYRFGPQSQLWLRLGSVDQDEQQTIPPPDPIYLGNIPRTRSVSLRHTFSLDTGSEVSYGFEGTRRRGSKSEFAPSDLGTVVGSEQYDDRSSDGWLGVRQHLGADWRVDGQLDWAHYGKTRHVVTNVLLDGVTYPVEDNQDAYNRTHVDPRVGLVYSPSPAFAIRTAWQRWQRPYGSGGLEPVTTADIPLPDQFVLPGGVVKRWRLQVDWEFTPHQFVSVFGDRVDVQNIAFANLSLDGLAVENIPMGVPQINSLLGDSLFSPTQLGTLGTTPIFTAGRIELAGVQYNALLWAHTSVYLSALHIHSRNTTSDFAGLPLPGLRERSALVGLAWAEGNWTANGELVYGSRYPVDESSGWDNAAPETRQAVFRGGWRSDDRRWQLYLVGRHTEGGGADNLLGLEAKLRF
ncbi:MAG: hypothetical protein JO218_02110, partial [Burkholderiales bacterium]|nr:hypothetical protein [Burkholderiales bacterium]